MDPSTLLRLALGLTGLVAGGDLLVRGAVRAADPLGVSPLLAGPVFVGVRPSTPELATGFDAALSGAPRTALGNVVGSNIFNVLGILGATALASPILVDPSLPQRDARTAAGTALMLVLFARTGWRTGRREAGILLGADAAPLWLVLS